MVELGYNYRLTDVGGGARVSSQLGRLEAFLARRRELAAHYLERLAGHPAVDAAGRGGGRRPGVALPVRPASAGPPARGPRRRSSGRCGPRTSASTSTTSRSTATRTTASAIPGLTFPVAEAAYERLLTLPLHAGMSDADLDDVVAALDKVDRRVRGHMSSREQGWI